MNYDYLSVARHEAAHAAAATLLGYLPVRIEVGQRGAVLGHVLYPMELDSRTARDNMMITLAPVITDDDTPSWPLLDVGTGGDYGNVVELAQALDLDEAGYHAILADTWKLCASPEFELLELGFSIALQYHSTLDRDVILAVVLAALGHQRVKELFLQPPKGRSQHDHTQTD